MTTTTTERPARVPVDPPISRGILEDRWAGAFYASHRGDLSMAGAELNNALFTLVQDVARLSDAERDDGMRVVDECWKTVRQTLLDAIEREGLAR